MNFLDQEIQSPQIYSERCADMNEKHVKLVDDTPHAALLYGGDPDNDRRPAFINGFTSVLPSADNAVLEFWLNNKALPPALLPLYEAKLKKLKMVKSTLEYKPDVLRKSVAIFD